MPEAHDVLVHLIIDREELTLTFVEGGQRNVFLFKKGLCFLASPHRRSYGFAHQG